MLEAFDPTRFIGPSKYFSIVYKFDSYAQRKILTWILELLYEPYQLR